MRRESCRPPVSKFQLSEIASLHDRTSAGREGKGDSASLLSCCEAPNFTSRAASSFSNCCTGWGGGHTTACWILAFLLHTHTCTCCLSGKIFHPWMSLPVPEVSWVQHSSRALPSQNRCHGLNCSLKDHCVSALTVVDSWILTWMFFSWIAKLR